MCFVVQEREIERWAPLHMGGERAEGLAHFVCIHMQVLSAHLQSVVCEFDVLVVRLCKCCVGKVASLSIIQNGGSGLSLPSPTFRSFSLPHFVNFHPTRTHQALESHPSTTSLSNTTYSCL